MIHQRFTFTYWNTAEYRGEEVMLIGTNYEDARSGAWAVLGDRVGERNPRDSWRMVSTRQEPLTLGVLRVLA